MSDLIEPRNKGITLAADIDSSRPKPGSVVIWWLGQSGFVIKSGATTIAVDLYLSEHLTKKYENTNRPHIRMTEAPLRGSELRGIDLILASHKHSDHLDPGTVPDVLKGSPQALLVVPEAIVGHVEGLGIDPDRIIGIDAGQTYERPGFSVRAIPSAHEGLDRDERGRHLYLGFVIEIAGKRLYHSGDSLVYEGLDDRLGPGPWDVFFLPINGRDPARGVPGNMSSTEAVALAGRLWPKYIVPHHYDMFTFNTVPIAEFEDAARALPEGVAPRILDCGERWEI
jgi:L-ascorbate metabolism protein UlaG (beta-lactamase superfamily)